MDGVWHRLTLAQEMFLNMEKAMEHCLPQLASHFQSQGIVADMYGIMTTSWFITIFIASKLPMRIVLSIWDQYLEHGIRTFEIFSISMIEHMIYYRIVLFVERLYIKVLCRYSKHMKVDY